MKRKVLIQSVREALVRRQATLVKALANHASRSVEDFTVGDSVDGALDCSQDEVNSQLSAVEQHELEATYAAFLRMRQGLYGICESCQKPIPAIRLRAVPYATLCVNCQRVEERHDKTGGVSDTGTVFVNSPRPPFRH